jgi:hypothetical protein
MSTAKDAYYLTNNTMQIDTMMYGPIESSFDVYDDFVNYESGTYLLFLIILLQLLISFIITVTCNFIFTILYFHRVTMYFVFT